MPKNKENKCQNENCKHGLNSCECLRCRPDLWEGEETFDEHLDSIKRD